MITELMHLSQVKGKMDVMISEGGVEVPIGTHVAYVYQCIVIVVPLGR